MPVPAPKVPDNIQRLDPALIPPAIDQAAATASSYVEKITARGLPLAGLKVLELGPGRDFGPALILAGLDASVTLADPYLPPWRDEYHRPLYRGLRERWGASVTLDRVIEAGGYDSILSFIGAPAESMPTVPDGCFDVVLSNAVLEHVADIRACSRELARVTRAGGWNMHQVDFRDHRRFDQPLEYLLLPEDEFAQIFQSWAGECGNQWRPREFEAWMESAGLAIEVNYPTERADPAYLADLLPRLRASPSRYSSWSPDDLKVTSAYYEMIRR